jgi:outer membrane protein OmpA-like peptidoglycan-associated protein
VRLRSGTTALAVAAAVALLAGACSDDPEPGGSTGAQGPSASSGPTTSVAPAMVTDEGFLHLNVLPQPVATQVVEDNERSDPRRARVQVVQAHKVGDVVRVVVAWDNPSDRAADRAYASLMSTVRPQRSVEDPYEIGLALYDPATGTLAEPMRLADGTCLCSTNTQKLTSRDKQALYWADFPAPASSTVTVLMGRAVAPFADVPVSADAADLALPSDLVDWGDSQPPATPGEGGSGVTQPVRRTVQGYGGSEDAQVGDKADVSLPADVLFALDSATLSSKAKQVLDDAAPKLAKAAKGQRVQVVGHTDDQGSDSYNQTLSERRAAAVVKALQSKVKSAGITLVAVGRGEKEPIVPNLDENGRGIEENRQRNRRVSFVFDRPKGGERVDVQALRPLPKMANARTTTPSPEVTDAVASFLSTDGKARLDVVRAERAGDDVWVGMALTAMSGTSRWGEDSGLFGKNPVARNATLVNTRLVDATQRTIAPPLSVGSGTCLCSEDVGAGTLLEKPMRMWAAFPAPDDGTSEVTLRVPGFGQLVDVPLT